MTTSSTISKLESSRRQDLPPTDQESQTVASAMARAHAAEKERDKLMQSNRSLAAENSGLRLTLSATADEALQANQNVRRLEAQPSWSKQRIDNLRELMGLGAGDNELTALEELIADAQRWREHVARPAPFNSLMTLEHAEVAAKAGEFIQDSNGTIYQKDGLAHPYVFWSDGKWVGTGGLTQLRDGWRIVADPSLPKAGQASQKATCVRWPDPTPDMLTRPDFEAVWQLIKSWDINVPGAYVGYTSATGNHVRAILDALGAARASHEVESGDSFGECSVCCGRGGRYDDVAQDQWYPCKGCEMAERIRELEATIRREREERASGKPSREWLLAEAERWQQAANNVAGGHKATEYGEGRMSAFAQVAACYRPRVEEAGNG